MATEVTMSKRPDNENVSFIANGDMGPIRIITRPTDDVFVNQDGYEQRVADAFAEQGVSVTVADVKKAMKTEEPVTRHS